MILKVFGKISATSSVNMLSVIVLSVIVLSVIVLSVIVMSVVAPIHFNLQEEPWAKFSTLEMAAWVQFTYVDMKQNCLT